MQGCSKVMNSKNTVCKDTVRGVKSLPKGVLQHMFHLYVTVCRKSVASKLLECVLTFTQV